MLAHSPARRPRSGAVELSQIVAGSFRSAYLGYHIGAPFARQGYMREALTVVLRLAFGPLRLHRVEAPRLREMPRNDPQTVPRGAGEEKATHGNQCVA